MIIEPNGVAENDSVRFNSRTRGNRRLHDYKYLFILFGMIRMQYSVLSLKQSLYSQCFAVCMYLILLLILFVLNAILVYRLVHDEERLQSYIEHYSRNWLSICIVLLTVVTILFSIVLLTFAIYMLRMRSKSPSSRYISAQTERQSERNPFFSETTTTRTATRSTSCDNNNSKRTGGNMGTNVKQQRKRLVEDIHVERTITFH